MECKWRPQSGISAQRRHAAGLGPVPPSPATDNSPSASVFQPLHAVDEVFDYASFMWDSGDIWQPASPDQVQNVSLDAQVMVGGLLTCYPLIDRMRGSDDTCH